MWFVVRFLVAMVGGYGGGWWWRSGSDKMRMGTAIDWGCMGCWGGSARLIENGNTLVGFGIAPALAAAEEEEHNCQNSEEDDTAYYTAYYGVAVWFVLGRRRGQCRGSRRRLVRVGIASFRCLCLCGLRLPVQLCRCRCRIHIGC